MRKAAILIVFNDNPFRLYVAHAAAYVEGAGLDGLLELLVLGVPRRSQYPILSVTGTSRGFTGSTSACRGCAR